MKLAWLPNFLTLARMAAALPLAWLLVGGQYLAALVLALVAGASDALDGLLAKRLGARTALGGLLDPLADKLLLAACVFGLWWGGHLPSWLVLLVLARDLAIVAGAWAYWRWIGPFRPAPSLLGKLTTLAQILLVTAVLAHLALAPLPAWLLDAMLWLAALLTAASGLDYVFRYAWRAYRASGSRE